MKIAMIPSEGAAAFVLLAKCLMLGKGNLAAARAAAERVGADRVMPLLSALLSADAIKAAVTEGSTTGWGAPLSQYQTIATQFLESLRSLAAFDAMLPAMRQVPLGMSRVVLTTTGAAGTAVAEGSPKPVSELSLDAAQFAPRKATCILVITAELARLENPQGLLAAELRAGVANATDEVFVAGLASGAPSIVSSGSDAAAFLDDLRRAVSLISLSSRSRLFLLAPPKTLAHIALLPGEDGLAFADLSVQGGSVAGITVVPSDGLLVDTSGGQLVLADASQIAAASATVTLDVSSEASVQLDSAPTHPAVSATVFRSLWQMDLLGLRAERWFSFAKLRTASAVTITSADYSGQG